VDGGGLTNVTPSTDGVTEGLAVGVPELVGCVLAGHALLLGLTCAKPWNAVVGDAVTRGRRGIQGGAGVTPGFAVTVTTMLSDTWMPCACASEPTENVAAPAVATLSMNVTIDVRRRDREFMLDAGSTANRW
jgi:hypothetical protein